MKRTEEQIQKEIEGIKENLPQTLKKLIVSIDREKEAAKKQINDLEIELKQLDYLVQVEDVVPGACFKNTNRDSDFVVFVVHDASPNMYRLSGNERSHPCSLYSDAARSRAAMAQHLSQHFPNKVPGQVKFVVPTKPVTKAGDILDCIPPNLPVEARLVRVYPDGTVTLFNLKDEVCNTFRSLESLNAQLDSRFPMYTRRA